jgi:hypothetical protein
MTMKTMEHLLEGCRFTEHLAERAKAALPIRPRTKKTRLFIDNEYFSEGYADALPLSALAVYAVLAKYANARTQACYPCVATIMRESGIRSAKTVFAAAKELERYRLIEISHSKGRSSNRYVLLDAKVWAKPNPIKSSDEQGQNLHPIPVENDPQSHRTKSKKEIIVEKEIEKCL